MPKQTFKQKIAAQIKKYDLDKQKLPDSVKKIVGFKGRKFKVKNPNNPIIIDPIPIDNRQGLKLMGKIPYRTGGVQARPEELLGQIDLRMFDMYGTNLSKPPPDTPPTTDEEDDLYE